MKRKAKAKAKAKAKDEDDESQMLKLREGRKEGRTVRARALPDRQRK